QAEPAARRHVGLHNGRYPRGSPRCRQRGRPRRPGDRSTAVGSELIMADATTASPSMMNAGAAASERIPPRRLFAFLIMVFGMFMSILDIQIVSASLAEIQAGLSASQSEVSWVQTSYLIAEVIAIPLSGFMSRALGTRLLFAISASGFTIASFFCGFASTLEQMIIWRAIQG